MDKLKLKGLNLDRVFHSRLGRACIGHAVVHITKQPNLKLKTEPKQLLGSLLLTFALPGTYFRSHMRYSLIWEPLRSATIFFERFKVCQRRPGANVIKLFIAVSYES
jgi:hypothetical protein